MNKFLYYLAPFALIQVFVIIPCSQPNVGYIQPDDAPILKVHILKEAYPDMRIFFESEIEQNLKIFYAQCGCRDMAHMRKSYGPEAILNYYNLACQKALNTYWHNQVERQAVQGREFIND